MHNHYALTLWTSTLYNNFQLFVIILIQLLFTFKVQTETIIDIHYDQPLRSWSTYSWISIVLSVFKRIITISWPLLWISIVDYHPCSTNSWIYIVLSVFERIITISWLLLWISCVDYHPWPWSTNSWIYVVLSLWITCVYYYD